LTDAGSDEPLCPYLSWNTTIQLFINFKCHTQIDLRYRQGWQCNHSGPGNEQFQWALL